jgi:hypothetical protein
LWSIEFLAGTRMLADEQPITHPRRADAANLTVISKRSGGGELPGHTLCQ